MEATGDSRIPGFADTVQQFILTKPNRLRQDAFDTQTQSVPSSTLLFHGTGLDALLSILRHRFRPASDTRFGPGLFMSEKPATSWPYSTYRGMHIGTWKNSQYKSNGLLLGCQVAGEGRSVKDNPEPRNAHVHVINNLELIMPVYLFLHPTKVAIKPPSRAAVESAIVAGIKKVQDGQIKF